MYEKIKKANLMQENKPVWNPVLCKHIYEEVYVDGYENVRKRMDRFPKEIRHLFYIWRAQCEIGGNGFNSLVYQGDAYEIKGIYEAFDELGLLKLKELMKFSIGMSLDEGQPDFLYQEIEDSLQIWLEGFEIESSPYCDIEELDKKEDVFELIVSEKVDEKLNDYIMKHLDLLAE